MTTFPALSADDQIAAMEARAESERTIYGQTTVPAMLRQGAAWGREVEQLKAERDILRADRDSACRMWQEAERGLEVAVDRWREMSRYLAIETAHAEDAEARAEAAMRELERLGQEFDAAALEGPK